jgi:hypothetical protein
MDQQHLIIWKRSLRSAPTRRDVVRGLAGAGLGFSALLGSAFGALDADAKKTRRKKKKKKQQRPVVNQFGCLDVDQPCRGDSTLCCSGVCAGSAPKKSKPDRSRCAAHGTGTCDQAKGYCSAASVAEVLCNNSAQCICLRTTGGSSFCAANNNASRCAACQRDSDCEALGFAPGSACAPFSTGACAGVCSSGMVCVAPCGTAAPAP